MLVTENKRLRKERESKNAGEFACSMCQSRVGCAVSSLGSTVSPTHPLQQGGTTQLAPSLTLTPGATILLKILTIYLLLKNCLVTSKETITSNDLKNLQRACYGRLQQKWKQILIEQMNKWVFRLLPIYSEIIITKYFDFITLYYRNEWIVWKIKRTLILYRVIYLKSSKFGCSSEKQIDIKFWEHRGRGNPKYKILVSSIYYKLYIEFNQFLYSKFFLLITLMRKLNTGNWNFIFDVLPLLNISCRSESWWFSETISVIVKYY